MAQQEWQQALASSEADAARLRCQLAEVQASAAAAMRQHAEQAEVRARGLLHYTLGIAVCDGG